MAERTCLYCDAVFTDRRQTVCKQHKLHHRSVLHFRRRNAERPAVTNCVDCGLVLENVQAKYCRPCRVKENVRRQRIRKAKAAGPKFERLCGQCGATIGTDRRRDAKFCSRKCIYDYRTANVDRTEYRQATQKQRSEYTRQWRKKNPISTRLSAYRRIYRESTGSITERDWQRALNRANGCCSYCGEKSKLTLDHVVPLSRGGTNTIGNVVPACQSCNSSKHARLLIEWRARKAKLAA